MKKTIFFAGILLLAILGNGLLHDMDLLHDHIIRLHVVGASDSEEDQRIKLAVKDAINDELKMLLANVDTVEDAKIQILGHLANLKARGEQVLHDNGVQENIVISLEQETFPLREYDTFSLPSGVYTSLRVRIGEARGKNWWCVVYPTVCVPAASKGDLSDTTKYKSAQIAKGGKRYVMRFKTVEIYEKIKKLITR